MTSSFRLSDLSRLRKLRVELSAIALARSNAISAECAAAADASEARRAAQQEDLPAALRRHLVATSALSGTNERFAAFAVSAAAERQALAGLANQARLDRLKADEALRAAEASRKTHSLQFRRNDSLTGIIARLEQEALRRLAPIEEDRALESFHAFGHGEEERA